MRQKHCIQKKFAKNKPVKSTDHETGMSDVT